MVEKLEISGVHTVVTPELRKYIIKKIGRLDKFMPKHARESAHVEVSLKESKAKDKKQCICEVIMYLPHGTIMAKEATMNMYAAVDIVEAKLKNHLKKYKETHSSLKIHRRILRRLQKK